MSHRSRGAWIEMTGAIKQLAKLMRRIAHAVRGLKYHDLHFA